MIIKTKTNKTFDCDSVLPTIDPERLYLHITNTPLHEIATVFTDEENELPIEGYPEFKKFDSMNTTRYGGINVCLK